MKALLSNYRQSPQKVRLVANLIRGKSVADAQAALMFLSKKSSPQIKKLLDSAVANARQRGISPDTLIIKNISVDKGQVLKRFKAMARGRGAGFRRTQSIVKLELAPALPKKVAKKTAQTK